MFDIWISDANPVEIQADFGMDPLCHKKREKGQTAYVFTFEAGRRKEKRILEIIYKTIV